MKPWEKYGQQDTRGGFSPEPAPWEKYQEPEESYSAEDRIGQFAGGANEFAVNLAGFPVDAARAMLESGTGIVGLPPAIEPLKEGQKDVGGSEWLMQKADEAGITGYPDTAFKKAGKYSAMGVSVVTAVKQMLGENVVKIMGKKAFNPMQGAPKGTARRVAEKMTDPLVTRPGATIASEVAGSSGAAMGGHVAKETLGPDWEMVGEFVFGMPASVLGDMAYSFAKVTAPTIRLNLEKTIPFDIEPGGATSLAKKAYHAGKSMGNARTRAANKLNEVSESPEMALRQMGKNKGRLVSGVTETPASKTGDRHLMALEQEIIKDDPTMYNLVDKSSSENYGIIKRELTALYDDFPVDVAQNELRKDLDTQIMLLDASLDKARHKVQVAVAMLGPDADRPTINKITRELIDTAASKARAHEKELWGKVDFDLPVSADSKKAVAKAYKDGLNDYLGKDRVPSSVKEMAKNKNLNTLEGLKKLRSVTLSAIRGEKAKIDTDWDKVRVLNDFQDEVLSHMRVTDKSPELNAAIGFSRDANAKLTRGVVGKIRGYDPAGGGRIEPELTLEATVGMGGPKSGVAARQLSDIQEVGGKRLLDEDPGDMVQDYLKKRLNIETTEGKVKLETAERFLRENEHALQRFPELKRQVRNAINLEKEYKALSKEVSAMKGSRELKSLGNLIEKPPGKFAETILTTGDGTKETARVWGKLSPDGKKAMKGDFLKFLEVSSRSKIKDGEYVLNGNKMKAVYGDHKNAFDMVLSKDEKRRLGRIMESLTESEFPKKDLPEVEGKMNDLLGSLFRVPSRVFGAKMGAKLGGGGGAGVNLQAAQLGASRAERLYTKMTPDRAAKLLHDAVTDEALYKDLLKYAAKIRGQSPKKMQLPEIPKYSPLHGWMVASGLDKLEEE